MYEGKYLAVIIAAGGMGTRFGFESAEGDPKQFISIGGKSMIMAAAEPFLRIGCVDEIIFVTPMGYSRHTCRLIVRELGGVWVHARSSAQMLMARYGDKETAVRVVHGGMDRASSVRSGLKAIHDDGAGGLVLIHDAARPFVSEDLIMRVLEASDKYGAAVPVARVSDTVYIMGEEGMAAGVPDRGRLRGAQTPQGFDLATIRLAHKRAADEGTSPTDDGAPVFAGGGRVALVDGEPANIKITVPEDLPEMTSFRGGESGLKAGIGFDAHRFREGRPLILGGVKIPFDKGLDGHSDADVLTHALMDAILGALHEGDIGKLFPDSDPALKGVSSMALLAGVVSLMDQRGYEIENVDLTVVAERPRVAPHREEIERWLSKALGTTHERVSLKATTTEKLGFTGREDGIAAEAIVLLKNKMILKGGWEE